MKKTIISLLLALCMVVCLTAVTASAEETTATAATHTDHCVCGGSAVGMQDHTCEDIQWTPLSEAVTAKSMTMSKVNFANIPSGRYYLDGNVTVTASGHLNSKQQFVLCLNGYNITASTSSAIGVFGYFRAGSSISICDCSGVQDADGNWTWGGTVTGGTRSYGGVFNLNANSLGYIYGGNFVATSGTSGLIFNVCNDGATYVSSSATNAQDIFYTKLTIYNGTFTGAKAATQGGIINVWHYSDVTIHGGTFTGGSGKNGGNLYLGAGEYLITGGTISGGQATVSTSGSGGNIYIGSGGDLTITGGWAWWGGNIIHDGGNTTAHELLITGGTISDGTATRNGGNICVQKAGKVLTISGDVTISGGTADNDEKVAANGGNIFSAGVMNIDGATITGGSAMHGGNIYLSDGTNEIKNSTISGGKANLMTDGTTNGNGGNILSAANATTTITGCTISGGEARRAGSVGVWGNVTIDNTTITGGYAYYNGGNIMTYGNGQLTLNAGTVLTEGEARNGGSAIHYSSNAGKKQVINEGAEIHAGKGTHTTLGINLGSGDLEIVGAPYIGTIYVNNASANQSLTVSEMTNTAPVEITVAKSGAFAASETDKTACFVNNQGYVIAYRSGYLYMDAPAVVYVSNNGSDDNNGSQTAPYKTVDHAMTMVADSGTVNIVDIVDVSSWAKHGKTVTVTGGEMNVTAASRLELQDNIHFKAMTLTLPYATADSIAAGSLSGFAVYCNGFKTVIDSDVTVQYSNGTTSSTISTIYGGARSAYVTSNGAITGTDLTVLSGSWGYIYGGNNATVLDGDVHLTVGGTVNAGLDYATLGHDPKTNGYNLVYGGSRSANINGTVYMTYTGNARANSVHGGSSGAVHVDNIELTVTGGESMALYGAGRGGAQTVGTINMYYQGGTFEQVFGGALNQPLTGDVNLYVTGGKITRRIYGGCYNETSGLGFATSHQVTGNITLYIGGGAQITCDLKEPGSSSGYSDRSIYGHSRCKATSTDAENSAIIFLDETAYTTYKDNLKYQDSAMALFMYGVSAADNLHYYTYTASGDTLTCSCVYDSTEHATAKLVLDPEVELTYRGEAVEPATVEYTNWEQLPVEIVYADNNKAGTATASITAGGQTATLSFTLENGALAQIGTKDYYTVQEAVNAVAANEYVKLIGSSDADITVSKDLYLDLNGFSLTGTVTVEEGYTLYGMDSSTDAYTCENDGSVKVVGNVALHHKTEVTGKVRRYLTYTEEDGSVSFHRIYLGITSMSLRPGVVGVGYKAAFRADEKAQSMLNEAEAFGYKLWLVKDKTEIGSATRYMSKDKFSNQGEVTLRLQNFDVENFGEAKVYAEVYLKLNDEAGTVIDSSDYYYTLREMLEAINENVDAYSDIQMSAIKAMCESQSEAMAGWDIGNILNWAPATAA